VNDSLLAGINQRTLSTADRRECVQGDTASEEVVNDSLRAGIGYYQSVQSEQGLWPGDYGGPMFLMPGLLIALYISKSLDKVLGPEHKREMVRYLRNHQNEDGGFGLHIEGHSTMFGTALR
jgi:cycloartenol synthase